MVSESDQRVGPRNRAQTVRGTIAVGLVLVLCGVLFVANAQIQREEGTRGPTDLAELLLAESERVAERQETVDDLRSEVGSLTETAQTPGLIYDAEAAQRLALAAGAVELEGGGVAITMSDAPAENALGTGIRPDDLVVHQQDLQSVVNALWAGGAEAMTIQGQRVITTSAVRCVGNTLMLHGQLYSPPYRIEAIGPQDSMMNSIMTDPGVGIYLQYVDAVGLGWTQETVDQVVVPPYESSVNASMVPEGIDVLATLDSQVPVQGTPPNS